MRIRRIRSGAIPQVRAALKAGTITLYRADELSKLPPNQQAAVLRQWVNRFAMRRDGSRLAAQVIRRELKGRSKVDLGEIAAAIRAAVRHG